MKIKSNDILTMVYA